MIFTQNAKKQVRDRGIAGYALALFSSEYMAGPPSLLCEIILMILFRLKKF